MTQFDVHRNLNDATAGSIPYVVNVQIDLLRHLNIRVVVPLGRRQAGFEVIRHLTPEVMIEGESLLFLVNHVASLPNAVLGPCVGNLSERRHDLLNAFDFLLTGV